MKCEFTIKTPPDFQSVIDFIFAHTNQDTSLVIKLQGDLGAGKTTFTQKLGAYLGVVEHIASPTFAIMKRYQITHAVYEELVHIDAYRLESPDEVYPLHLESVISGPHTIACIEWPENISECIPQDAVLVNIAIDEDETRRVEVVL
jgi:tRNA threonylcarbamoyladenosine biosynthesis protein TsaE